MVAGRRLSIADFGIFIVYSIIFLVGQGASAQEVQVTARVDSNNILIGDWLKLHVDVAHPSSVNVAWPTIPDSLEGFEIVQRGEHQTRQDGQNILETTDFTITSFDTGTRVIPPLSFQYSLPGDTVKKVVETSPILVVVHGIAVDTTRDIKDVKPPLTVPISFAELLPYIAVVVALGGLGVFLYYYMRRKRLKEMGMIPEAPRRPAHEVALEGLHALEAERVWQRGKVKEYYSQLTDIVRTYIEQRFDVLAMEMTTDEILGSHGIQMLEKDVKQELKEGLVRADLVKFAKFQPFPEENEASLPHAISFVELTWQEPVKADQTEVAAEVNV